MPVKKIAWLICLLMLLVGCTDEKNIACVDDNYSDDHAVNVARCLQSLEDGTAYEIDETLTAKAPWKVGDIVAKFGDGEGGYILREFLGVTQAGYYLVQDYATGFVGKDYPPYPAERITNERKVTDPFALMNLCAVTDSKTSTLGAWEPPYVCGSFTNYYVSSSKPKIRSHGVMLDGAIEGEWLRYQSNNNISYKGIYIDGLRDGLHLFYSGDKSEPYIISCYDNGQMLFLLRFEDEGLVKLIPKPEQDSAFVDYDETSGTIQHGYWINGEKAGTWRKWDLQGMLIEEIFYGL